ncbi:TOBE domain-containing protein [Halobaculum sp. P14]|uniref:TOBE domain-containing protein n=1 Tax=Halobaculum sp. P14 TaxID=3421638 RepID=UPI003EB971BE
MTDGERAATDSAGPDDSTAADFAASLRADDVTFDGSDAALLRAVARTGSVSAASDELGRSRARALTRLEELESVFGDLVERRRGGSGGGGSRLARNGEAVLAQFDRLRAALAGTAGAAETVVVGAVTARDGELATVDSAAGPLRALAAADLAAGDAVQVSVRADAVTLHAPDETPSPDATSARNRFSGAVESVDRGESVVEVAVDVGAAEPLRALVTADSADRLGLAPDGAVVASFKATATRATPRRDDEQ